MEVKGDVWTCNNQCGSNCCSFIFLHLDDTQLKSYQETGSYEADEDYTDWQWLALHKDVIIDNNGFGRTRTVKLLIPGEIKTHPITKQTLIYAKAKCSKLMPNNQCAIYRTRPQVCRKSGCIALSNNPVLNWFGKPIREEMGIAEPLLKIGGTHG